VPAAAAVGAGRLAPLGASLPLRLRRFLEADRHAEGACTLACTAAQPRWGEGRQQGGEAQRWEGAQEGVGGLPLRGAGGGKGEIGGPLQQGLLGGLEHGGGWATGALAKHRLLALAQAGLQQERLGRRVAARVARPALALSPPCWRG
jgi:hypothetical protein